MVNDFNWDLDSDVIYHFGIKGQKWGVRRFQNEDGSLTPEGRKRLGLDTYMPKEWSQDYVIKKGTKATRVLKGIEDIDDDYNSYVDFKPIDKYEKEHNTKYMSIDNVRKSGRYHELFTTQAKHYFKDEELSAKSGKE